MRIIVAKIPKELEESFKMYSDFRRCVFLIQELKEGGLSVDKIRETLKESMIRTIKEYGQGKDPIKDESFFAYMTGLHNAAIEEVFGDGQT